MSERSRTTSRATWVALTVVAVVGVLAAALSALWIRSDAAPMALTPEQWDAQLVRCVGDEEFLVDAMNIDLARDTGALSARDCLVNVVITASKEGQIVPLSAALRTRVEKDDRFYSACHDMLHTAGAQAYFMYGSMVEMIEKNQADACGIGFIHGGLDSVVKSNPTVSEAAAIQAKCLEVKMRNPAMGRLAGMCAHGLGHVAWLVTRSFDDAAEYCHALEGAPMRAACVDGVLMDAYEPVNSGKADLPLIGAFRDLPGICKAWPYKAEDGFGCDYGSGYLYMRPAHAFSYAWLSRESFDTQTLAPHEEVLLENLVRSGAALCKRHESPDAIAACLELAAAEVPFAARWSPALLDRVCPTFDTWESKCREGEVFF